jgi:hypothetical protein
LPLLRREHVIKQRLRTGILGLFAGFVGNNPNADNILPLFSLDSNAASLDADPVKPHVWKTHLP